MLSCSSLTYAYRQVMVTSVCFAAVGVQIATTLVVAEEHQRAPFLAMT